MTALSATASFWSCARVRYSSQMRNKNQNLGGSRARRWYAYLWHEWTVESRRPIAAAFARPNPAEWSDNRITAAWLGHATVLINFFGIKPTNHSNSHGSRGHQDDFERVRPLAEARAGHHRVDR